jgi:hypothetical protein
MEVLADDFEFKIGEWRNVVRPAAPAPDGVSITILLDPAPTANSTSDESAFTVSYVNQRESDGVNELVVLSMDADRWKGGLLADRTLDLIQQWPPTKFVYEDNPGLDWFRDLLELKAASKGIILPRIEAFTPHNGRLQKSRRIRRLQTVFDVDPPAIAFHRGAYIEKLFEQADKFRMNSDQKRKKNDMLDSLALSCGYR